MAVDSNKPSFWWNGQFRVFSSTGSPVISYGESPTQITGSEVVGRGSVPLPAWVESAYLDQDGALFVWYHHEVIGVCPGSRLATPKIGAAVSWDGGRTLVDLGIVLESGDEPDCQAANGYFAGGHGDFSVVYDPRTGYFYFLFSNYGGSAAGQGVAVARAPYEARFSPAGSVEKYYQGQWTEPGVRGKVSPIVPVTVQWQREDTDAFWGPSVHWNTYLNSWVMLLNHACCQPDWPQEGIYIAFNADLTDANGWSKPELLIGAGDWYPSVLGSGLLETDSIAGKTARLFLRGLSEWEIVFHNADLPE